MAEVTTHELQTKVGEFLAPKPQRLL